MFQHILHDKNYNRKDNSKEYQWDKGLEFMNLVVQDPAGCNQAWNRYSL